MCIAANSEILEEFKNHQAVQIKVDTILPD